MQIKVFSQEKLDGLEKAIANNITTSISKLENRVFDEKELPKVIEQCSASGVDFSTLHPLRDVLVSTVWNGNDDVFDPTETWNARNTPEDQPFNFMHDDNDIIGHIIGSYCADFEGNVLHDPREQFDIITDSVLYKYNSDPVKQDRIDSIIAEIATTDKWYVSMECMFPHFDYALMDDQGKMYTIERNEASSFMTKYLRIYGGSGKFSKYKIGRLLRSFSFSGKGLVTKPANPRSIIVKGEYFNETKSEKVLATTLNLEIQMEEEIKNLKEQLVVATKKIEDLTAKEAELASANEQVTVVKEANEVLTKKIESLEASEKALAEENNKMKKEQRDLGRKAKLVKANMSAELITETLAKLADVPEDIFDIVVKASGTKTVSDTDSLDNVEETVVDVDLSAEAGEIPDISATTQNFISGVMKSGKFLNKGKK